jgi:hypothetical protein
VSVRARWSSVMAIGMVRTVCAHGAARRTKPDNDCEACPRLSDVTLGT